MTTQRCRGSSDRIDEFPGASLREDRNGTRLTVLSAFARLDVDPWQEATSLALMPRVPPRRVDHIDRRLPSEPAIDIPSG